jgi:hypothetical protein
MSDKIVYNNFSSSDYYDWIVNHTNNAESIYYLIRKRLVGMLYRVYKIYGYGLNDTFEDTIDDFFLYLYDWNLTDSQKPFAIMEGIRNKAAFFGWVVSTYRFFLLNKTREEEKRIQLINEARLQFHEEEAQHPQEAMVHLLTTAIAYADQHFTPRNRFLCYRMLLSLLDHSRAIPQERMAQALEMHPVTYRVCTKRQKDKLGDYILLQEAGHVLTLDVAHQFMRDRMANEFHQLYELLMEYYNETLGLLPTAEKIKALRVEYGRYNGTTVHEEIQYGFKDVDEVCLLFGALNKMP